MSKTVFGDDRPARRVIRITLVVELLLLLPVAVLSMSPFEPAGYCLAGLAVLAFWGVVFRLFARYRANPLLQEKSALKARADGLRARIGLELTRIQAAQQMRDYLSLAQKNEATTALYSLQEAFLRRGLAGARITDAQLEAIGPKLRETLAMHRVVSAADVHPKVLLSVPGLGAAERQALLIWRDNVFQRLDHDKPAALPDEELVSIRQKYETENASNNAAEREAYSRKERLETELSGLQPRVAELSGLTFGNYLWETLASQKEVAGVSALLLFLTQICLLSYLGLGAIKPR